MQIRVTTARPWDVEADVLALAIPTDDSDDRGLAEIDRRLDGTIAEYRRVGELRGKPWSAAFFRSPGLGAAWTLAISTGDEAGFDRVTAVRLGSAIVRRLAGRDLSRLAVYLPASLGSPPGSPSPPSAGPSSGSAPGLDPAGLVELVARGVVEGTFEPATIYRDAPETPPVDLEEVTVVVPDGDDGALTKAAERGRIIGEGSNRARRLAQRASNDVSPDVLADEATRIAHDHGLTVEVFGPDKAAELGMGMFLAVGKGSDAPPRFIVLRSGEPGRTDSRGRLLAMVGKGVTFDSGGISIKPSERMEEMKMDKTGACTVISAIATVSQLAPGLPLMAVAPAVENMPGSHSTRPGDIVRAMNGKVVEINNTDAEGRLILGDALVWAERQGATHLVDVATLTGAVERAFGKLITGGFGTPQEWWDEVAAAGARQGERYWQIPLIDDYRSDMESWYADFQNSSSADGSLVKSGLFLREFATRPWAHLDVGGSAYLRKPTPWAARGATGVTHATLVELALAGAA
jgi:leucyl aminopeptidase